jgi:hypothetical protein
MKSGGAAGAGEHGHDQVIAAGKVDLDGARRGRVDHLVRDWFSGRFVKRGEGHLSAWGIGRNLGTPQSEQLLISAGQFARD